MVNIGVHSSWQDLAERILAPNESSCFGRLQRLQACLNWRMTVAAAEKGGSCTNKHDSFSLQVLIMRQQLTAPV